jgi:hypothetical protein
MYNCINIELWKRACHKMRDCIYKRSVRSWTTTKTSFYTKQTVRQLYMLCRLYYTTCSVIVYIRRTWPANNFISATHEDTQPASSSKPHRNISFETQYRMRLKSKIIQSHVAYTNNYSFHALRLRVYVVIVNSLQVRWRLLDPKFIRMKWIKAQRRITSVSAGCSLDGDAPSTKSSI